MTNENIQSDEFFKNYEFCQEKKTFVIFITLEEIKLNSNLFNLHQLNSLDKSCLKHEDLINQLTNFILKYTTEKLK
jgi:hypothetical protein